MEHQKSILEILVKHRGNVPYDYQLKFKKNTPVHIREQYNVGDIFSNTIQCNLCKDIIRSKNKHDMVWCSCHTVAIDGGSHYIKPTGIEGSYTLMTEYFDDVVIQSDNQNTPYSDNLNGEFI